MNTDGSSALLNLQNKLLPLTDRIRALLDEPRSAPYIVVLDGDAGAGKSTAAAFLSEYFGADVVHMDDFFLPAFLRTDARLSEPGGNVHYERFLSEVLPHLSKREAFTYRRFDCTKMDYCGLREIAAAQLIVVEGAYCLHPAFGRYYDVAAFCTISPELQKERIIARAGAAQYARFEAKWIPMERRYQDRFGIRSRCDPVLTLD